ncbi:anti-sigma factor [Granulicella mallensis]|uniref:Anti-sigma K factor RskA C-terminal domain-containing protein n=1 Tax=Granulicella mallensis TaxID=940614 RepID=A0A7W8EAW9_9BACT|nr:anti-sigma factor [Granulicella mallensis]MBB5064969.1 hypothetical protein [Granulicella mallensis]
MIPLMAASAAAEIDSLPRESDSTIAAAERRLMARLESPVTLPQNSAPKRPSWHVWGIGLAACFVVFGAFAYSRFVRHGSERRQLSISQSSANGPSVPPTVTLARSADSLALQQSQAEAATLRRQISAIENSSVRSESSAATLRHQLQAEQSQRDQIVSERDSLSAQLSTAQAESQALREKLASSESSVGQQGVQVSALEAKVRLLDAALEETNSALDDRERMLALDKDFMQHDRDIRDLIGARDLYIADIFDTNESGKTTKPFGRLFYTQNRSLVFYGFDLEKQPGLKQAAAFQAWGSGSDSQPINLGLFYQDDSHKRWVLRFNDPKTLARMNMVFVTVEPPGGSNKPTGKQLLRAYLQIQPNHP